MEVDALNKGKKGGGKDKSKDKGKNAKDKSKNAKDESKTDKGKQQGAAVQIEGYCGVFWQMGSQATGTPVAALEEEAAENMKALTIREPEIPTDLTPSSGGDSWMFGMKKNHLFRRNRMPA